MVLDALTYIALASLLSWVVATARIFFRGRLIVAMASAALLSFCGFAAVLVIGNARRSSHFWIGESGGGDGQGLIGVTVIAGGAVALGLCLMFLSWIAARVAAHFGRGGEELGGYRG